MNDSSRHRLSAHHFFGSLGIAAVFAAITTGFLLFIVVVGALIVAAIGRGDIEVSQRLSKETTHAPRPLSSRSIRE